MRNLKKLFKSKTFYIPAFSYIGIIVLLFIGAYLESIKIFPAGDMGGQFFWILFFVSLPIVGLHQYLKSITHYKLEGLIFVFSLVLMFVYHLLISFILGFITNFIYRRLKSRKSVNVEKANESPKLEPTKQEGSRKKFFRFLIVLMVISLIIGGGIYLWRKTLR